MKNCENCQKNNNAEWDELTCPLKGAGECEAEEQHIDKAAMLSIQPKWCQLIASGEKTIEVRKARPKLETPFKCYIYCTKKDDGRYLYHISYRDFGKVIGEFVCDRIDKQLVFHRGITRIMVQGYKEKLTALCKGATLSLDELHDYIDKDGKDLELAYGWHISNLKIYDKPKELGEFYCKANCDYVNTGYCKICTGDCKYHKGEFYHTMTRPPQSWCYVEEL